MDDDQEKLLKTIFWDMNNISSRTEDKLETVITETDDGNGNIVQIKIQKEEHIYILLSRTRQHMIWHQNMDLIRNNENI